MRDTLKNSRSSLRSNRLTRHIALGLGLTLGIVGGALAAEPSASSKDADATQPTFYRDVSMILEKHCQDCHRLAGNANSGMVAPMPLIDYEDVRPWARAMAREVMAGSMPPWYTTKEFHGVFKEERGLTDQEIDTLVRWARAGAPAGDPADAPPPREFPSAEGWTLGVPDLVIKMPEPYWVADDVEDIQPAFEVRLTEDQLPEDRWIHWIEFRPGNTRLVHHGGARTIPVDADGNPVEDNIAGGKIIGTAPGDGPDIWPVGYGKLVRKGSIIRFGMHYHKEPGEGSGGWDQSMIAIKWHTEPVEHVVRAAGVSSRGWEIPPNASSWPVGAVHEFTEDSYIINMMPHMHTRGKAAQYTLVYPDGRRELLLDVPKYNYNWQLTYSYREPKFVPKGSRLEVLMTFDNSPDNPYIIDDPNRPVGFGGMTVDEMNIGWTEIANAKPITDIDNHEFSKIGNANVDAD